MRGYDKYYVDHLIRIYLIAVYARMEVIDGSLLPIPFFQAHCFVAPKICPNEYVTFYLYTSENTSVELSVSDPKSIKNTKFNRGPIKILLHGYRGNKDDSPNAQIRPAYFRSTKNINVISVDYEPLVAGRGCYVHAVRNTDLAANCTAQFVETLLKIRPDVRLSRIHFIGLSLGAHVAGLIATFLKTEGKIERITSLDAALPLYLNFPTSNFRAINRGDAKFIDALHTNAGFAGQFTPYADVDFYANGGTFQPGCSFWDLKCDHELSAVYYAESINSPIGFTAQSCHFPPPFTLGYCHQKEGRTVLFGEYVDPNVRGNYSFQTGDKPPFALLESK